MHSLQEEFPTYLFFAFTIIAQQPGLERAHMIGTDGENLSSKLLSMNLAPQSI